MSVKYLLQQKGGEVHAIAPDASLEDCVSRLNEKRIGALVVQDKDGTLQGIVSERDILRAVDEPGGTLAGRTVGDIMTPREKLITTTSAQDVRDVMDTMTHHRIRHVPVLEGDTVVGIVSIGDAVKMLLDEVLTENKQLQGYISGEYA
ncbi:MAG: CBS domain-containing protein [Lentisphaerae bacterium]|nr:CBS domain-containing protein [Lentisphaerota bacterium]